MLLKIQNLNQAIILKFRVIDHSLEIENGTKIHQDIKYFVSM